MEETPLIHAAKLGKKDTVLEQLIRLGANPLQETKEHKRTALLEAVRAGQLSAAEFLMNRSEYKANLSNSLGVTPLAEAIMEDNATAVKHLIACGEDVNHENQLRKTPLIIACELGQLACADALVRNGAGLNAETSSGLFPLLAAAEASNVECMEALIRSGANVEHTNKNGVTVLSWACRNEKTSLVEALLHLGASPHTGRDFAQEPLPCAIRVQHVPTIGVLLALSGLEMDREGSTGDTALLTAIDSGNDDILKLVLERGANPNYENAKEVTPLMHAALRGRLATIEVLLQFGADLNYETRSGSTVLASTCEAGDLPMYKELVTKGADRNYVFVRGEQAGHTYLTAAVLKADEEAVNLLIDAGTDVNYEVNGETALMAASINDNTDMLELLARRGMADVNKETTDGYTALIAAVREGRKRSVAKLVELGVRMNHVTVIGLHAVTMAICGGKSDCLQLLLDSGANPEAENGEGHSPVLE
eukprot:scaffold7563_cov578-Prasinococcus_capsulatus_cf.AAC.1